MEKDKLLWVKGDQGLFAIYYSNALKKQKLQWWCFYHYKEKLNQQHKGNNGFKRTQATNIHDFKNDENDNNDDERITDQRLVTSIHNQHDLYKKK